MADIELVIKIPEEEYRWIKKSDKTVFADVASKECMLHAIKNGTPLPKGHGKLIDVDDIRVIELEDNLHFIRHEKGDEIEFYIEASTIIEVDAEREE